MVEGWSSLALHKVDIGRGCRFLHSGNRREQQAYLQPHAHLRAVGWTAWFLRGQREEGREQESQRATRFTSHGEPSEQVFSSATGHQSHRRGHAESWVD